MTADTAKVVAMMLLQFSVELCPGQVAVGCQIDAVDLCLQFSVELCSMIFTRWLPLQGRLTILC